MRPYLYTALILVALTNVAKAATQDEVVAFGRAMFHEARFSNPGSDMEASCASCHAEVDPLGSRAFTELFQRSWHPWRTEDPGRETLRNTPTLLDVGEHAFIHMDGEFATLEDQVRGTLVGRNFGWLPGEESAALARVRWVFDNNPSHSESYESAFDVTISDRSDVQVADDIATATAAFMRTLKSEFDSPYDEFMRVNRLPLQPSANETPKAYADGVLARLQSARFISGFDAKALEGYRIFLRSSGRDKAGNCVACHVPPLFMDDTYHNTGVSQMEYEKFHGAGSFDTIVIPIRNVNEISPAQFRSISRRRDQGHVDLGHWNFARPETSPLRLPGDSREAFFARTIGTFKTPPLRHLGSTDPYMHSGEYDFLEWAVEQKVEAAFLARMGQLRNGDEELKSIRLDPNDVKALVAFLNTLNDQGERRAVPAPTQGSAGYSSGAYSQN
ncbi:MAG: cytochrome c peroxidase [Candidatus Hydrogenedentota bacterium]